MNSENSAPSAFGLSVAGSILILSLAENLSARDPFFVPLVADRLTSTTRKDTDGLRLPKRQTFMLTDRASARRPHRAPVPRRRRMTGRSPHLLGAGPNVADLVGAAEGTSWPRCLRAWRRRAARTGRRLVRSGCRR